MGRKRLIPIVDMEAPERNSDRYLIYIYIYRYIENEKERKRKPDRVGLEAAHIAHAFHRYHGWRHHHQFNKIAPIRIENHMFSIKDS